MTMPDRFQYVQQEYARLRGQLSAGMISAQQFEEMVKQLGFQDAGGHYWMIGRDNGRWYMHNGQAWIETNPYPSTPAASYTPPPASYPAPQPYSPPPQPVYYPQQAYYQPPRKGGGCWRWLACGCLAVFLLTILTGVGGFVAYQSGVLSLETLMNLVGMGPAHVEVDNFRDEVIYVTITQLDVPEDEYPRTYSYVLNPFDVILSTVADAGRYQVNFGYSSGSSELGVCTLTLKSGDNFQFVPLPDQIVVNDVDHPASSGVDLVVSTSSYCR